ncbi:hypothetical protein SCATT_p13250 (plasmid) [Streptantibioticus cattleyicolor NRRL 8057 = DSM 46488]|uniref:Secreted protein n=2 Tax=Streptantibioticus cattleyicolor TaxID=29303 RepID=G8XFQ7_STREN|nr:hypothetical protein SCATT_p13250 [Streptantibioticus cattleyicolor NRRL 8057 = DSM 46488]
MMASRSTRWAALAVLVPGFLTGAGGPAGPAAATPTPTARPVPPAPPECRPDRFPADASAAADPVPVSALAGCLRAAGRNAGTAPALRPAEVGVTARTMTVTGLMCPLVPLGDGVCAAGSVVLDDVVVRYDGPARMCLRASRMTIGGPVRIRAERLSGLLLGHLPVTLSTRLLPGVPVPWIQLTDVEAQGVAMTADRVETDEAVLAGEGGCRAGRVSSPTG